MEKDINKKWNWQGLLIISILMVAGFLKIYFTWGSRELSLQNFYEYFCKDGLAFIFALFFITVGIYCYYKIIINSIIKPKLDVLYLSAVNEINSYIYELIFLDGKGKKYQYF